MPQLAALCKVSTPERIRPEIDTLTREPRFDILFEPATSGPVEKNRFYQPSPQESWIVREQLDSGTQ